MPKTARVWRKSDRVTLKTARVWRKSDRVTPKTARVCRKSDQVQMRSWIEQVEERRLKTSRPVITPS